MKTIVWTNNRGENNCLASLPHLSYSHPVKTLTVRLPDVLATRIEQESITRRVSKSVIVRDLLDRPALPLLKGNGIGDILEECWAAKVPKQPPRFRSPKKQKLAEIIRAKKLHR